MFMRLCLREPKTRLYIDLHDYLPRTERLTRPATFVLISFVDDQKKRNYVQSSDSTWTSLAVSSATLPASLIISCEANARYREKHE